MTRPTRIALKSLALLLLVAAGAAAAAMVGARPAAADAQAGVSGSYSVHVDRPGSPYDCGGAAPDPIGWWVSLDDGTLLDSGTTSDAACVGTPSGYMLTYGFTWYAPETTSLPASFTLTLDMGTPTTFAGSSSTAPPAATTSVATTSPATTSTGTDAATTVAATGSSTTTSAPTDAAAPSSATTTDSTSTSAVTDAQAALDALDARIAALEAEVAALTAKVDRLAAATDAAWLAYQQAILDGDDAATAADIARGTALNVIYGLGDYAP